MPDREKVIKGIEHCIGDDCNGDKWSECEYSGHGCIDALLKDALALLKAQEPVVMAGAELTDTELIEKIRKAPFVLKPAVDAIPVEWMREKMRGYASSLKSTETAALVTVLTIWEKEQEAR